MKDIRIHTIPHKDQRYDTVGDWVWQPDGSLDLYISDMGNPDSEWLCAMHELTEVWLCKRARITQSKVDAWDKSWKPTNSLNPDEPGCDPKAPYHKQHEAGEVIERVLCALMGIDWHEYNASYEDIG